LKAQWDNNDSEFRFKKFRVYFVCEKSQLWDFYIFYHRACNISIITFFLCVTLRRRKFFLAYIILYKKRHTKKREIAEMLFIKKCNSTNLFVKRYGKFNCSIWRSYQCYTIVFYFFVFVFFYFGSDFVKCLLSRRFSLWTYFLL